MPTARTTLVLPVDAAKPAPSPIAQAAEVLRKNGLVAFPTETVYGLGAAALVPTAVRGVFEAKGRPASDPLIVHLADAEGLDELTVDAPVLARDLARRFWPGPLTLVLRRAACMPLEVTAGRETVAVRVPAHPVALALLRAAGMPVVAPSANLFSRPSPTTAKHVLDDLRGRIDVVLDAGRTPIGVESSVVDLTTPTPTLLRPGGVPLEALRELIPGLRYEPRYVGAHEAAASPGMLLKHYAPRTPLTLYAGGRDAVLARMRADAHGRRVGVLALEEDASAFAAAAVQVRTLGRASDPAALAHELYAALRDLDTAHLDAIFARLPATEGLGLALCDRLTRAAEGRIVRVG